MRGLRGRLTLGITTVLAVVLVVAGVVVAREVDRSERQVLDDRLRRTAELSRATAVTAVQQGLPDADRRLDAVLRATRSSLRLAIGDTVLLDSGVTLDPHRPPPLGFDTAAVGGTRYRTYAETLRDPGLGGLVRLEVATSLADLENRRAALRRRLALIGARGAARRGRRGLARGRPRPAPAAPAARRGGRDRDRGRPRALGPRPRPGRAARAGGELQRDARRGWRARPTTATARSTRPAASPPTPGTSCARR